MESTVTVGGRVSALSPRVQWASLATWFLGFSLIALVAGTAGGFRPTTWAWTALVTWWLAVLAFILVRNRSLGALDFTMMGASLAFAGWFAASALWSQSAPSTLDETIRYVAYAGIVVSALLVVDRRTAPHLVGGVAAAIALVALYSLGTRTLPDRLGAFDSVGANYRLSVPITYWNGLGIFCVMGLLLALGFAARGERLATRVIAAAPIPLLAATMYFTFSRGAWVALIVGLAAAFLLDPRRLQLALATLLLGLVAAAAVWLCSRGDGLVTQGATLAQATRDGHRLAPQLVGLAVLSAAVGGALALGERRLRISATLRLAWIVVLVVVAVGAVGLAWSKAGSPVHVARVAWREANAPPKVVAGPVGGRLFDLSSNGRFELWHTSWDAFRDSPVAGSGGGTFWQLWAASPRQTFATVEGHSVYFETLAELGIVGLAILLLVLVPPLVAAVRVRTTPLVPFVLAAFVGWLVHAGVDWDWELMGVTGAALLCGVALVAFARRERAELPQWLRFGSAVAAVALALVSMASVVSAQRLASADSALGAGLDTKAAGEARSARTFAPWSVAALDLLAEAQANAGLDADALETRRRIVARDPNSWSAWLSLAVAASGAERLRASAEAARLNPRAPRL